MTSKTGFIGVYEHGNGFAAQVTVKGKKHYIGYYDCPIEAAKARDAAVVSIQSRPRLNFENGEPLWADEKAVQHWIDNPPQKSVVITTNKTGFIGVTRHGYKFQARINLDGKQNKCIGLFDTALEAAQARDAAALKHHKNPRLNFRNGKPEAANLEVDNTVEPRISVTDNPTGFLGVTEVGSRYRAQAYYQGRNRHIGFFSTPLAAAKARDAWAIKNLRRPKLNFWQDGSPAWADPKAVVRWQNA